MNNLRQIKRNVVGAFIFSADNKLLLGRGGVYRGTWLVPGGGVDEGETKLDALKREVKEETGINISGASVEPIKKILTGESRKVLRHTGEEVLVKMKFYNFKIVLDKTAAEVIVETEDDFTDAQWVSVPDLKKLRLSPPSLETLSFMGYL